MITPCFSPYGYPSFGYREVFENFFSHIWGDTPAHGLTTYRDETETVLRSSVHEYPNIRTLNGDKGNLAKTRTLTLGTGACKGNDTLGRIKGMPLEIIYEILVHVKPPILLNLSMVNRRMREILMNKRSRFVWKASLANVRGLPSCPPDVTEPQYANLLFRENCQFCNQDGVKDVFWTCSVRCCLDCVPKEFLTEAELRKLIPDDIHIEKLDSVFPYIVVHEHHSKQPHQETFYHPNAAKGITQLKDAVASRGSGVINTWISSMKEDQIDRLKHAPLCEHWYNCWVIRHLPIDSQIPVFDIAVTAVLSTALVFLWKDKILG